MPAPLTPEEEALEETKVATTEVSRLMFEMEADKDKSRAKEFQDRYDNEIKKLMLSATNQLQRVRNLPLLKSLLYTINLLAVKKAEYDARPAAGSGRKSRRKALKKRKTRKH